MVRTPSAVKQAMAANGFFVNAAAQGNNRQEKRILDLILLALAIDGLYVIGRVLYKVICVTDKPPGPSARHGPSVQVQLTYEDIQLAVRALQDILLAVAAIKKRWSS